MSEPHIAGWRESIEVPAWGIDNLTAKPDTGARSSCMDARGMEIDPDQPDRVRFTFEGPNGPVECDEEILDWRLVRDSGGHQELRPVIRCRFAMGGRAWDDEVTLHDRSAMRHRVLIGRRALAGHFMVDPERTFVLTQAADGILAGASTA